MPGIFDDLPQTNTAPRSGSIFDDVNVPTGTATQAAEHNDEGFDVGGAALGAGLLGGAALLASKTPLGKLFKGANAVRQQLMLSGLAVPKSALGNVGATIAHAAETRSLNPLRQLFSRQTLDDAVQAYKTGGSAGPTPGLTLPGPNPGKVMGAMDDATQKALQRAGLTAEESQAAVLQAPLHKPIADALESPAAQYVMPFRRTPINAALEGAKTFRSDYAHKGVRNAYIGAGAVHGVATADEQYPTSVALATALSAKYGLPYALAAVAARKLIAGGQGGGGILGSALPVSEYGVEQSLSDPTAPFVRPAASRFFE